MSGSEGRASANGKPRYDWYQTEAYVVVTVMIRNLNAENVSVEFTELTADLSCKMEENTEYALHLQLYRKINTKESSFKVTSSKVELKMKKAESTRWAHLESAGESSTLEAPQTLVVVSNNGTESAAALVQDV